MDRDGERLSGRREAPEEPAAGTRMMMAAMSCFGRRRPALQEETPNPWPLWKLRAKMWEGVSVGLLVCLN